MPAGSACWRFHQEAALSEQNRPRRHAVHADVRRGELQRQGFRQADLGGLHRVVRHASASLAAEDRRDDDDRTAAAGAQVRHGEPRRPHGREQRLIERFLPVDIGRVDDAGTAPETDVVHEHVDSAETAHGFVDDSLDAFCTADVGGDGKDTIGTSDIADLASRLEQSRFSSRAERDETSFGRKRTRARVSKATARTRDDRDFVSQLEIHRRNHI
jgi:hypothetical protein